MIDEIDRQDEATPPPAGELLMQYFSAVHRLANSLAEKPLLSDVDLSIGEWIVLFEIKDGDLPVGRLGTKAGLSRQRLHTLLSEIETRGFVKVVTNESGDRRRRTVTITDEGREVIARFNQRFEAADLTTLGKNGPGILGKGVRLIRRVSKLLPNTNGEPEPAA